MMLGCSKCRSIRSSRRMRFASVTCEKTCVIFLMATLSFGWPGVHAAHTSPSAAHTHGCERALRCKEEGRWRTCAPSDVIEQLVSLQDVGPNPSEELAVCGVARSCWLVRGHGTKQLGPLAGRLFSPQAIANKIWGGIIKGHMNGNW